MSNMYAIKETTLTALGNAIRSKQFLGEASVTSTMPFVQNTLAPNVSDIYKFSLSDKAHSLKIYLSTEYDYSTAYQIFYTTDKKYNNTTMPPNELQYWIQDLSQPLEITGNYVAFYCRRLDTAHRNIVPFNVTIIGYDENGNVAGSLTPTEMVDAINELKVGNVEPIVLTGDCRYGCAGIMSSKFIELYSDKVSTKNITYAENMFLNYQLKEIPFDLNFDKSTTSHEIGSLFYGAQNLESLPKINDVKPKSLNYLFSGCYRLREIPENFAERIDWSYLSTLTSAYNGNSANMFRNCYSLRKIPSNIFNNLNPISTYSYTYFTNGFMSCYALDELANLPIPYTATYTSSLFSSAFSSNYHLKRMTFALKDGQPIKVNWKSQTINLSTVGYTAGVSSYFLNYNSGITEDKRVMDDATYQALKNDEDWFTTKIEYSRYNRTSAVETINSLPDTSEYLATAGGTNTITFKGAAGANTDGGAINTMTEEEIAVAIAKGWTVTFV